MKPLVCFSVCVQHGACVNAMDLWQFTPLHEAASKNRVEVKFSSLMILPSPQIITLTGVLL